MVKGFKKAIINPEADEKIVWCGSPSQIINLPLYIFCALTFFTIIPIFVALYFWFETKQTTYELTTDRVLMRKGIFYRRLDDLELYRVKDICLLEPVLLRVFKLSSIELVTSDLTFPDIILAGIENGIQLRETVRKLVLSAREKKQVREVDYYYEKK